MTDLSRPGEKAADVSNRIELAALIRMALQQASIEGETQAANELRLILGDLGLEHTILFPSHTDLRARRRSG